MKTIAAVLVIAAMAPMAQAKTLAVNCEDQRGQSVKLVTEIAKATETQLVQSLQINGSAVNPRDVSRLPLVVDGKISLKLQFGKMFYSSVDITLDSKKCNDNFEAAGKGMLSNYVGGFAGTEKSQLDCFCELK